MNQVERSRSGCTSRLWMKTFSGDDSNRSGAHNRSSRKVSRDGCADHTGKASLAGWGWVVGR
jgi:hypothetical protein